jgi:hypothetical protein
MLAKLTVLVFVVGFVLCSSTSATRSATTSATKPFTPTLNTVQLNFNNIYYNSQRPIYSAGSVRASVFPVGNANLHYPQDDFAYSNYFNYGSVSVPTNPVNFAVPRGVYPEQVVGNFPVNPVNNFPITTPLDVAVRNFDQATR